ncbi:MAG: N4-gp56 family major capsid protein [Candidatus Kerfeldbacteria bacterium CG_4_10_14_0_8_um_filter_42_10]|uniref:N4-gp56 family major capsid protein n=1 Tax=Candidatus Kerfeldbacteria bacterium CG_4_10_14_0_8_um_filter_42_10 TaxID=2014248 RepID=A0A2M7RHP4_9BACT|nr:MAG: N4-gp56 family major capsid protein [Candidatus Kerfeldbacteria bacterium CG_4_10_14_0_8_um_filter_42_10]
MANTTKTQIPDENASFYDRTLLTRAVPFLTYTKYAQIRDIPKNAGTSMIKFRRYGTLAAATTPLSEGITPVGSQLSVTDITATVAQYGDYITLTDVVDMTSEDPVLMEAAEILGDQFGDTTDQLARNIFAAGTGVTYAASAGTRVATVAGDKITGTLVKKVVRTMKNNKARKMTKMVNPDSGYATAPIPACYVAIVHPNTTYDLKDDTAFQPVEKYANKANVMEGEVGAMDEVRFVESTNAKVFAGEGAAGIDVYGTIFFAMNGVGVTRISGEAVKNIIKPLGSGGTTDPLNQRSTSGWKSTFVAKILNQDFIHRLEHGVTA